MAEPYINLIYGWSLTEKLTLAGSTGYLGMRRTAGARVTRPTTFSGFINRSSPSTRWESGRRFSMSGTCSCSQTAPDNRPLHFMDGGILYRLSTNIQVDLRAGFGLSGRPDDFFTGTGLSFRY